MKLTKTWLSYIIWGLFSIIFFTNIGIAAIEIGVQYETNNFLMPMAVLYGGTIVGILLLIGVYKLIEKFVLPKIKSDGETQALNGPGEWFVLALVVFVAIAVRAIAIISAGGQLTGITEFYDYAIGNIDSIELTGHNNATYFYCGILGFLLNFIGHFPMAAMSVQTGIQVITIIVTYLAVKKALGRVPAWIAVVLMSFLPGSFLSVRICAPDSLLTMLFAFYMFALVCLGQANRDQKIKIGVHGLFYVLIGVFAAFLTYLDWTGILAYAIGIVTFVQYKNEDAWLKIQKPFLQVLWFSIAFVLAVFLMLWFLPTGGVESGPAAVMEFVNTLLPSGALNLMIMSPHKGQWDALALFVFSGLWFFGFLRNKQDKAFPYAFIIVFLTIASFVEIGSYDYTWMASYLWIMLSTIGITSIDDFRRTERDVEVAEKTKETNAKRKAERERKRAEAAGEKSIRLDDIHEKKNPGYDGKNKVGMSVGRSIDSASAQQPSDNDGSVKKSYGIGRKAETVPNTECSENKTETMAGISDVSVNSDASTSVITPIVASSGYSGSMPDEKYSVVKKVDRPPLGMPASLTPMQPQYGYSPGSRSRRSLRSPSKSTFTPEDLERISRYTGVNYMASQTVSVRTEEPQIIEETIENNVHATDIIPEVVETPIENVSNTDVVQTPVVQEEAVSDIDVNVSVETAENVKEVKSSSESVVDTEIETVDSSTDTVDHSVSYIELDATQNDEEKKVEEIVPDVEEVSTLAPYVSPSRRHFRHPSKSTFSPEELEKISQYTGVSYKKSDWSQSSEKESEKSVEETPVEQSVHEAVSPDKISTHAEKVPAHSERIADKKEQTTDNSAMDLIKTNPERKPKMIRNPLPGPKPHVARELSYDYNPKPSEMEFDIVDMKGKDFFDL